jgi:hypothetical protein
MHHFASFWKKNFWGGQTPDPPSLPLLVSRGLACMPVHSNFVDENVMRSVALYRKQIEQDW